MMHDEGCATCHRLDPDVGDAYLGSYEGRDPLHFRSNFRAMRIDVCTGCHLPEAAGDGCLICHRYHVGPKVATNVRGHLALSENAR